MRFDLEEVESIHIWIHERRLKHTNRPLPKGELDAKFSVQYVVARALMDGYVAIEHFEEAAFTDPKVLAFMQKIEAQPYGVEQFDTSNHFGGQVQIRLKDGKSLQAKVQQPLGRTSENPLPENRLKAKFELCAKRIISEDALTQAYDAIQNFEALENIYNLTLLLKTN
jgi:2-methylcitrate dehydratase PrpD